MVSRPISIRCDEALLAEIDRLAAAVDRSRNYVIVQALTAYVERTSAAEKSGGGKKKKKKKKKARRGD